MKNHYMAYKKGFGIMTLLFAFLLIGNGLFAQSTLWLGNDSDWNKASNWTNGVPHNGYTAIVSNTPDGGQFPIYEGSPVIDFTLQNSGTMTFNTVVYNLGTLINFQGGVISSSDYFVNAGTISFDNDGSFHSSGNLDNYGMIDNAASGDLSITAGTFNNHGQVVNFGDFNISAGVTANNYGSIESSKNIDVQGTLNNNGRINSGPGSTMAIGSSAVLNNKIGAELECTCDLSNNGTVSNNGDMLVNFSSVFNNNGVLQNATNFGLSGLMNNNGTCLNSSSIDILDAGNLHNFGALQNSGSIELNVCGKLMQHANNNIGGTVLSDGLVYTMNGSVNVTSSDLGFESSNINDRKIPIAGCKPNVFVTLGADGTVTIPNNTIDKGSYGSCGASLVSVTLTPNSFTTADLGQQVVRLDIEDEFGFTSFCDAVITVIAPQEPIAAIDDQDITASCPDDITLTTIAGANSAVATWTEPVATTTCSGSSTTCTNAAIVRWDLDQCLAFSDAYSFDEFTPEYTSADSCLNIQASNIYRNDPGTYYHSCLEGVSGNAMCLSGTWVDYLPSNSVHTVRFSTTVSPSTTGQISGLQFYQKSETHISNINSNTINTNDYLQKFAVRVRINNNIVFESANNPTSQSDWSLATFDFSNVSAINNITSATTLDFELVAWDPADVANFDVRVWELDEIELLGCCSGATTPDCSQSPNEISGLIFMGEQDGSKYYCSSSSDYTWSQAKILAENYGGYLAVINDAQENSFIQNAIINSSVWIGFTDETSEGNFKWTNGSPVTYTNWNSGEPNNVGGEDYTLLYKNSGKWDDVNGTTESEAFIEIPCPEAAVISCSNAPTVDGMMFLGTFENSHYYKNTTTGDLPYGDAKAIVEAKGGTLPMIGSQAENDFLTNAVGGQFWLGISDANQEGNWKWNNGATASYTNWDANQPDNWNSNEDYASVRTNGKWNDIYAEANYWAILELPCTSGSGGGTSGEVTVEQIAGIQNGEKFPVGTNQVAYQFTDDCGNQEICLFDVIVEGTPSELTITCVENIMVDALPGATSATVSYTEPTVSTTCYNDGAFIERSDEGPANGEAFPIGTTFVNYAASDSCANFEGCVFTVTVNETPAVLNVLTCSDDINSSEEVVTFSAPTGSTTCYTGGVTVTQIAGPTSGSVFPEGTTEILYLLTDDCSNTEICSFNVNVSLCNPQGTPCDDNDNCTTNDIEDGDCNCAGTFQDTDNDGVCDEEDCQPEDNTLPAAPGTACDDEDPTTGDDVVLADGCTCLGTDLPGLTVGSVTVNEEDGTISVPVCLDFVSDEDVTVEYQNNSGTALAAEDFEFTIGVLTIPAGELCADILIDIIDDENPEPTEELTVNLVTPTNAIIVGEIGTVTILDTDVTPDPVLTIGDITVNEEDGTATLEICLDETSTETVTVNYMTANGSALLNTDYSFNSGQVSIAPGELCTEVTVVILDDENPEPTEELVVNLTNSTNATIGDAQGTITILDADVTSDPVLTISDITVNEEDGTATLEICLDEASTETVVVNYMTANGSALLNTDYSFNSGQVSIAPGELCTEVTVVILDDENPEPTEELVVNLTNATNATIGDAQGTITILDADVTSDPVLTISDITVNEEDGTATLEICLDEVSAETVTVNYMTANGSALLNTDYSFNSGQVSIAPGELCTEVTVVILDDENPEPTEELVVNLTNATNATIGDAQGTITILDTDEAPLPNVVISDIIVNEEDGTATLEICLDEISDEVVTIDFSTANGSALEGSDYTTQTGTATIAAGELCATIEIAILDDENPEPTEELVVNLTNPSNAGIADGQGTITILDTDVAELPEVIIKDVTVNEEDGTATVDICLVSAASEEVTVDYVTENGTAIDGSDYTATTGTATILAGETCTSVEVTILDDENEEDTEVLYVNLNNATNATIADPQGTVTILDTDGQVGGCEAIEITESNGVVTTSGYSDPIVFVKIYDNAWNLLFDSGMLTNNETQTYTLPAIGDYWVFVKSYDMTWTPLCDEYAVIKVEESNTCADLGGDSDGDGVCDDNDVCPGFDDNIDVDGNGIPDGCDVVKEVCIERVATSPGVHCPGTFNEGTPYAGYLPMVGQGSFYDLEDGELIEYTDGTALITGTWVNLDDPTLAFEFAFELSEKTGVAPADSPKEHHCSDIDYSEFYYYSKLEGTLTGLGLAEGAVISVERFGAAFQIGYGAITIATEDRLGASAWIQGEVVEEATTGFSIEFITGPNGQIGDIAVNLTGTGDECLPDDMGTTTTENSPCGTEVTLADGTITVGGYSEPIAIVQVFDASWSLVYSCMGDCENPQTIDGLTSGRYYVKVNLFTANWQSACQEFAGYYDVNSTLGLQGQSDNYLFFTAAKDSRAVALNWTVNTAYKTDMFVAERSNDGIHFEPIFDHVNNRDTEDAAFYQDADQSPQLGRNYYRVKQIFNDGTYRYSHVQTIDFDLDLIDFTVYPNPTTERIFVNLSEYSGLAGSIEITNNLGVVLNRVDFDAVPLEAVELNVTTYATGMYNINVKLDGYKHLTKRFVKTRK